MLLGRVDVARVKVDCLTLNRGMIEEKNQRNKQRYGESKIGFRFTLLKKWLLCLGVSTLNTKFLLLRHPHHKVVLCQWQQRS